MSKALRQQILELASRKSGFHSSDIPDRDTTYVLSRANELVGEGKLFKVRVAYKRVEFFTDKKTADQVQRKSEAANAAKVQAASMSPRSAGWAKNAEVVFTKATKFTKCPSPPPRFASVATPNIHGGNQRGRVSVNESHEVGK